MDKKVFVIGLDGATWDLIDLFVSQGELPTFKKLIDNGSRGILLLLLRGHHFLQAVLLIIMVFLILPIVKKVRMNLLHIVQGIEDVIPYGKY
jgi:hypothetical protein